MAKSRERTIKKKLNLFKKKVKKKKKLTKNETEDRDRLLEILNEESNLVKTKNRGKPL